MLKVVMWDDYDAITHDLRMCGTVVTLLPVTIIAFAIPLAARDDAIKVDVHQYS
jgi:hypothetical protein